MQRAFTNCNNSKYVYVYKVLAKGQYKIVFIFFRSSEKTACIGWPRHALAMDSADNGRCGYLLL